MGNAGKHGPDKMHMVLDSNPTIDDTLKLLVLVVVGWSTSQGFT